MAGVCMIGQAWRVGRRRVILGTISGYYGYLDSTGHAWMAGTNAGGQLGDQTVTQRSTFNVVVGNHLFKTGSLGASTSVMGVKPDGSAWGWGTNSNGQLGNLSLTGTSSPVAVVGGFNFVEVTPGQSNYAGLDTTGTVWCWGYAGYGQLGNNTTTRTSSPVAVVGSHSFNKLLRGTGYMTKGAVKSDGSVWVWGSLYVGDNTLNLRSSPTLVAGGHVCTQGSTWGYNKCGGALVKTADGSCWTWGNNDAGQLGTGNTTVYSSPTAVVGAHSFTKVIACGPATTGGMMIGLKANGQAWAWGTNAVGQLGDGSITARNSPVRVVGGHSFVDVFTGYDRCMAIKADGSLYIWGSNPQLVAGAAAYYSTPQLVKIMY